MDMPRDFIGYANAPPRFTWPEGAHLALNIVINYEEGAERNRLDHDDDLELLSEAPYRVPQGERELATESFYEFGSRVGIWRILSVLDRYGVRPTIFACGQAVERNQRAAQAFAERGYDIVGHGYRWISHFGLSEAEERAHIRKATESIQRTTGQRIIGWFTRPPQTSATRRILAQEGFLYDCGAFNDDLPYFQPVEGRPFLVIPYTLDINDIRFWKGGLSTGKDFQDYCKDSFDTLYEESTSAPRMMSIGLHPRIIGRPGRIAGLDRFLSHVRRHPKVWIASRTDIARFWASHFAAPTAWNWPQ